MKIKCPKCGNQQKDNNPEPGEGNACICSNCYAILVMEQDIFGKLSYQQVPPDFLEQAKQTQPDMVVLFELLMQTYRMLNEKKKQKDN